MLTTAVCTESGMIFEVQVSNKHSRTQEQKNFPGQTVSGTALRPLMVYKKDLRHEERREIL